MKKSLGILSAMMVGVAVFGGSISYEFPLLKTANIDQGQADGDLSAIRIDNEIHRAITNYATDLRIVNDSGKEVPFIVQKFARTSNQLAYASNPAKIKKQRKTAGKIEMYIIPAGGDVTAFRGIDVVTDAKNFEKAISVAVFQGGKWKPLFQGEICDLSEHAPFRKDRIVFPAEESGSMFRVTIENIAEGKVTPYSPTILEVTGGVNAKQYRAAIRKGEMIKVNSINLISPGAKATSQTDVMAESSVEVTSTQNQTDKTEISLKTAKQPLTGFTIATTSVNFSRSVTIEGMEAANGDQAAEWKPISTGTISAHEYKTFKKKQLEVKFPESRFESYRITIINGSNPPLENLGVTASGPIYQALMSGKQSDSLTVYYGLNKMPPPTFDTSALLSKAASESLRTYTLAAEQKNAGYHQKWYQGKLKYLLGLIFVIVAGALSFFLLKSMRKNDGSSNSEAKKED